MIYLSFYIFVHNTGLFQRLTEQEMLVLHAKVKALQQRYGLSYKDAAHRLYHSELRVMDVAEDMAGQSGSLHAQVEDNFISDLRERLAQIDEGTM